VAAAAPEAPPPAPTVTTPGSALRLGRVDRRAGFDALRRRGTRGRSGPVAVTWVAADPGADEARVAFAVGRTAGGAVVRNRIRRRLRASLRLEAASGTLPTGTYLVRAGAELASMPWDDLVRHVRRAVGTATGDQP
jgi:ribonuclease P protein component